MELSVTILNFLRYEDKETKKPKIRIGYINNDSAYIENGLKFKGYPELSVFLDDNELWDKLIVEMVGGVAKFVFDKKPNPRNPLKDITVLKEIRTKEYGNISLL